MQRLLLVPFLLSLGWGQSNAPLTTCLQESSGNYLDCVQDTFTGTALVIRGGGTGDQGTSELRPWVAQNRSEPPVTAPTKAALDQVKPTVTFNGVVVLFNGTFAVAQLSPSVVLDTSGQGPVIRAVLPVPVEEEFLITTAQTVFTLASLPMPSSSLMVFRNGVKMRVGRDYTAAGKVVTFTAQPTAPGDLIVAWYWPAG